MDIDYAIRHEEPFVVDDDNEPYEISLFERWEWSNHLNVIFIKTKISAAIRGSVDHHTSVKELLKTIDEQFETSEKVLASTLIMKFSTLRLTGIKGVCDYIMQMRDIKAQLTTLEVEMSETFQCTTFLILFHQLTDSSRSPTTYTRTSGPLMNCLTCMFKKKEGW